MGVGYLVDNARHGIEGNLEITVLEIDQFADHFRDIERRIGDGDRRAEEFDFSELVSVASSPRYRISDEFVGGRSDRDRPRDWDRRGQALALREKPSGTRQKVLASSGSAGRICPEARGLASHGRRTPTQDWPG